MDDRRPGRLFAMLARLASRRPRRVVAVALVVAVVAAAFGHSVSEELEPYAPTPAPGSESERAAEAFERAAGIDPDGGLIAVLDADGAPGSTATRAKLRRVERTLRADPTVAAVLPPPGVPGPAAVSRDGSRLYVVAAYRPDVSLDAQQDAARRLVPRLRELGATLGGSGVVWSQGNDVTQEDFRRAELLSFPFLLLLSLWFFRSGVAALIAASFGALAIVAAMSVLRVLTELTYVSIFALNIITALGVGLAFDYCLLVINRYREELARGHEPPAALARTLDTAGRAVLLSACTIAASLAAMLVFPDRSLSSMGFAGAAVTFASCGLALVVLPGALALLGHRINGLSPRWLRRRAERESRPLHAGGWFRLARLVTRRPVIFALAASIALLALALPALRMNITEGGAELLPAERSGSQVAAAVEREFEPAYATRPLRAVATGAAPGELRAYAERLSRLPGVAAVAPPRPLSPSVSLVDVVPAAAPTSPGGKRVVERVREVRAPFDVAVGGDTAILVDRTDSMVDHIPQAAAIAVLATIVALFLLTHSVVLPIKAIAMNVLSIGATLGLMVLVFQDGRLEDLLGYESQGGLILAIPPFVAALAFGLATDYGIFVLSRIKERVDAGARDADAIAEGLERTGRVVTAAALLFVVAVGATVTGHMLPAKEAGLGMSVAVLIDAMIVRTFLVPSLMVLLGRANWWSPRLLVRLVSRPRPPAAAAATHTETR